MFDRVTIRLHNGKTLQLVRKHNSRDNKYIQSVRFNGQPQNRIWFRHADVLQGLRSISKCPTPRTLLSGPRQPSCRNRA